MPSSDCCAVIFTSKRTNVDEAGYAAAAARMDELARTMPGFMGIESARSVDGVGITVSYWDGLESIHAWREHPTHAAIQQLGRDRWYEWYRIRIARVAENREFPAE
jgi:heme-degrading monooxygenase HmoA